VLVRGIRIGRRIDPPAIYDNVTLGAEHVFGIPDTGFFETEVSGGAPGRWTNGAATLRVPVDPQKPPRMLGVEVVVGGRDHAELEVRANGSALFHRRLPRGLWSKTFDIGRVPLGDELLIELNSGTRSPAETTAGLGDRRNLGVFVRGIRLAGRDRLAAAVSTGMTIGLEPIFGVPESGFYRPELVGGEPARWTDGAATLTVPLNPGNPPRQLEIETSAPGRDLVHLQVLANDAELWNGPIPAERWSHALELGGVPASDTLLIELNSDTFVPAEVREGANDRRKLGFAVRGIRLTASASSATAPRRR
jgi:hypothetical protein